MAVVNEEFIRCECGGADFEKKEVLTLPKNVKRSDNMVELPALERVINYYCIACRKQLNK